MCDIVLHQATELTLNGEDVANQNDPLRSAFFLKSSVKRMAGGTKSSNAVFGIRTDFHRLKRESPKLGQHQDEMRVCADFLKRDEPAFVLNDGGLKSVNVCVVDCLKFLCCFLNFRGSHVLFGDLIVSAVGATDELALARKDGGQISVIPIADQVFARERRGNEGCDEVGKCQDGRMHVSFGPENPGEFLHKNVGDSGSRNDDASLMRVDFCKRGDVTRGVDTSAREGLYLVLSWCVL